MSLGNALLGLLSHGPMTGYDLKKLLDHPIGFFLGCSDESNIQGAK